MSSVKTKRIGSQIQKELSEIIRDEAKDSLLHGITITAVVVTNDISLAKVYFTSLSELPKGDLVREVNEAAGFLRKELAERIDIRHTPALRFIYDESIAYGEKIEKIIQDLNE